MAIDTILVAVGRDDEARVNRLMEVAIELAEETDSDVVVGHAFETQGDVDDALDRLDLADGSPTDVARRLESVRRASRALDDAGVDYEVSGVVGSAGEAISGLAERVGADRVIVGGRKRSPTGKAVFGSAAQRIMLSSPCPVTFVRE
ncbi:universal stress protein [Halobaculum sp. D14]|uniref:universal stress protein n=1 Tax=unclassified Halobaculum TaxID=2640896 RepID=UPI003EC0437C